jgi:hypothetical protein
MFHNKLWFSRKRDENYNFLRTFKNPNNSNMSNDTKPLVIKNLIFNYNESTGDLIFVEMGRNLESHSAIQNLKEINPSSQAKLLIENWGQNGILKNMRIAQVTYVNILQGIDKAYKDRFSIMPCNLDWGSSNSRRFTVSLKHGKCLKFVASSYGDIFVVFATNPNNEWTWYFIQISSYGVALYRVI